MGYLNHKGDHLWLRTIQRVNRVRKSKRGKWKVALGEFVFKKDESLSRKSGRAFRQA